MKRISVKNLCVIIILSFLVACGPINPPEPPSNIFNVSFVVCETNPCNNNYVQGARITFEGTNRPVLTTNLYGYADSTSNKNSYNIRIQAEGYQDATFPLVVERRINKDVVLVRIVPPLTRVRTEGRFFLNEPGTFRPVWTSALTLLKKTAEEQTAYLKQAKDLGFNGVRVFAGALPWANQNPEDALAALSAALARARAEGLYFYVVANTESGTGYDVPSHTAAIAGQCAEADNCIFEGANEYWHPTQSDFVQDVSRLQNLLLQVVPSQVVWATGAAQVDEGGDYPAQAGNFSTAHLDRGRDKWNQVRRVREIAGISEGTGKPALSGEPIGAAEQAQDGRRESDPNFFYAYGALCRLFEVGCVFHSDQGLQATPLTDNQLVCASAFIKGFNDLDTTDRLTYKNATWTDSPVKSFSGAVRVYSGVSGDHGYTVAVGVDGNLEVEWQNGWRHVGTISDLGPVKVYRVRRGES